MGTVEPKWGYNTCVKIIPYYLHSQVSPQHRVTKCYFSYVVVAAFDILKSNSIAFLLFYYEHLVNYPERVVTSSPEVRNNLLE